MMKLNLNVLRQTKTFVFTQYIICGPVWYLGHPFSFKSVHITLLDCILFSANNDSAPSDRSRQLLKNVIMYVLCDYVVMFSLGPNHYKIKHNCPISSVNDLLPVKDNVAVFAVNYVTHKKTLNLLFL